MPFHGQLRQLRAWSDRPGRRDPWAKKGGRSAKDPTKICQKEKKEKRQIALAAARNRRTRTRRERRRRAKAYEQAASQEKTSHVIQRGGDKKKQKKKRVRRKFGKTIRRMRRQKQRRQEQNRKIWQELHSTWLKTKSVEDSTVQPATEEVMETSVSPTRSQMMIRSAKNQHWLAVGHETTDEAASVGRCIGDGVLLRVSANINGRRLTALIDSGASRCYMSPNTAAQCELKLEKETMYLELADGSKIQATQKASNVCCEVGKAVCKVTFTVTQLLHNVDLVLGINWLAQWNPVVDWRKQIVSIWTGYEWTQVNGLLLQSVHNIGTVKEFVYYGMSDGETNVPDFTVVKVPQFWEYTGNKNEWRRVEQRNTVQNCSIEQEMKTAGADVVQKQRSSKEASQRQLVTAKQMAKYMQKNEPVYLALIRPNPVQRSQGMTQKIKRDQMKQSGPVRKAPPVAETRKKICSDAPSNVRKELHSLLEEFSDLFPEQLPKGRPPKRSVEFEIKTVEGTVPPNKPPYRLSPKEHDELQAQIDDLLAQGHIRPSQSPYGAPVLFVPKKDGRWRMCIDYRALNKQTIRDRYPLPRIDDLLDRLGKARHFTTLDLASGYHQIAVKEEDIPKTAFRTQRGQFEFVVMPFGVTNAPATFQRMMNALFKEELDAYVLVYLDDILIFSQTLEDHIHHIRQALQKLRDAQLFARLHKCSFFQKKVEYLGFDVSGDGVQPSPEKVRTVVEWPRPQGVKDVRSFLGLASFYRRFIRNFSYKARPLTDLTKDGILWHWDDPEEKAFRTLKKSLVTAPVLRMPDFERPFIVTTDASLVSVGAILEQDFGRGLQPVAFESRKLNPAETRYSAYERELLGIVWAIGKWRHYFEGRKFIVQTDHSSLRHLPNQPSVNRRIWKWISILQGYDMEIRHIPGKVNPADTLTRQVKVADEEYAGEVKQMDRDLVDSLRIAEDATDVQIQAKIRQLYNTSELKPKQDQALQQILTTQSTDQDAVLAVYEHQVRLNKQFKTQLFNSLKVDDQYTDIIQELQDPEQSNEVKVSKQTYRMKAGTLMVHEEGQDVTANYWRTVVPNDLDIKRMILHELHYVPYSGHPGFTRTLQVVRQFFYWKHMSPDVRDFVLDCPVCQTEKGSNLKPGGELQPLEIPARKWDHVAIDFITGMPACDGKDTILTVVDKATKMCHFVPCAETVSAKDVARLYWTHVGKLHGIPQAIISDRDPRFTGKFWRELWRLLGTDLRMGSGYHPESSGQVEKFNQLLEQTIRCTIHQVAEAHRWLELLPVIEFAVNSTPNRTTGYTGFYLNYGFHPLHPLQLLDSPNQTNVESVVSFTSRLQGDFMVAKEQLQRAQQQMKQVADQHRRAVDYTEGDQVLLNTRYLRFRNCPRKLQRRFVGPFPIEQKIGKAAYKLQLPKTWTVHPVFHTSLLRPWRSSEWSCPVNTPAPDVQVSDEPFYEVDKILKWRKTTVGRRTIKEYLVTWTGYPLEDAQWIPETNWRDPTKLKAYIKQDKPTEERAKPKTSSTTP